MSRLELTSGARRLIRRLGGPPSSLPPVSDGRDDPVAFHIEAESLGKTYHTGEMDVEVLTDLSLVVTPGEFVSVMGPSGSGKSTLLYLLGGLDAPSSGSVKIKGRDIGDLNDIEASRMRRRDIGFVFQFYNLVPNLNLEENVMLPVLLDGKDLYAYKERLDEILETVGLADRRHHTPRELSGGQQQRVAIARALINEPDIILADEPTGNLDSHSGEEVIELLARINRDKGRTIVMVTHSHAAAAHAGRIITLKDGRIENDK